MAGLDTQELADGRILLDRDGHIARITFNQPERMNAMSLSMWQGLTDALKALAEDDAIRVVILRGAGDKAFVSGADISEFDKLRSSEDSIQTYNAVSEGADKALYNFPKPTIAQIKGFCVGGGMGLAIACDMRIAAEDSRLGITAAKLGLGYGFDGVAKLVDLAGPEVAARVLFTASLFPADEALSMGLVSEIVPRAALEGRVTELATRIATNAPLTVQAAKITIRAALRPERESHRAAIGELTARCYQSADYAEGRKAFAEKRPPNFTGK
jgi:enoyl-CoA hydratase